MVFTLDMAHSALEASVRKLDLQGDLLCSKNTEFEHKKTELEILSKLIRTLSSGQHAKEGITIKDEETKKLVIYMHRYDSGIFAEFITSFPEGLLSQPVKPANSSLEGFLNAGCQGLTESLSEVELTPIPPDAIEFITRRLSDIQEFKTTEVRNLASDVQMIHADRGQLTSITRDSSDQRKKLMDLINSNARG